MKRDLRRDENMPSSQNKTQNNIQTILSGGTSVFLCHSMKTTFCLSSYGENTSRLLKKQISCPPFSHGAISLCFCFLKKTLKNMKKVHKKPQLKNSRYLILDKMQQVNKAYWSIFQQYCSSICTQTCRVTMDSIPATYSLVSLQLNSHALHAVLLIALYSL